MAKGVLALVAFVVHLPILMEGAWIKPAPVKPRLLLLVAMVVGIRRAGVGDSLEPVVAVLFLKVSIRPFGH